MIRDGEEPYTNSKKKRKIDITIADGKKNTVEKSKSFNTTKRRKKYSNDVKGINKLILKFKMQHHSKAHIRNFLKRVVNVLNSFKRELTSLNKTKRVKSRTLK